MQKLGIPPQVRVTEEAKVHGRQWAGREAPLATTALSILVLFHLPMQSRCWPNKCALITESLGFSLVANHNN